MVYKHVKNIIKNDWNAHWIWADGDERSKDMWASFRKKVIIKENSDILKNVKAYVACDSKYWLYVNGAMVVRDGGLKRGPTPTDGYFDVVDIGSYLKNGENTIAVLAWFWGSDSTFSYTTSGKAGFLFECRVGDNKIVSDSSWKAIVNPAFKNDSGDQLPNYRMAEFNVFYDANYELCDWYMPDFEDSLWKNAVSYDIAGEGVWGKLYERTIPLLKDFGLKDYMNSGDYCNYTTDRDEQISLRIPYNAQCTPYLSINAPSGLKIKITTDNTERQKAVNSTYITKSGDQSFESPGWFNGEIITYHLPAGVTIKALKYRESGYATEFVGSFVSDNNFFNVLWEKCLRTLYVTMRDNYMDCPDRERAQWWGDVTNEMAMSMYSLDTASYMLYQKGVLTIMNFADAHKGSGTEYEKILQTVVPIRYNKKFFELPAQQMAGVCGFERYYQYTGDKEFVEAIYPYALEYLKLWNMEESGFVVHRAGTWDWLDWGDKADRVAIDNAWYYMSSLAVISMAEVLDRSDEVIFLHERRSSIYSAYKTLWTEKGYKSTYVDEPDDRANALAVLSGLADEDKYPTILELFKNTFNSSPYMERYVCDALCEMGEIEAAQERIVKRYTEMVEFDYSTLWEGWENSNPAWTLNHAWTGGPMLTMSQYMAGIEPIEAAYKTYKVAPSFGCLKEINCVVPSIIGDIVLNAKKEIDKTVLNIDSPAFARLVVGIKHFGTPNNINVKLDGILVFCDGKLSEGQDISLYGIDKEFIYLSPNSENGGKYIFEYFKY